MSDAEAIWRGKTDDQVADAATQLSGYTEEGERIIRGELRRRGMADPPATQRQSGEPAAVVRVTVVDVQMPFTSMVVFMLKWALAAIPAGIILFILARIILGLLS